MHKHITKLVALSLLTLPVLTSCYRMPEEDEYSLIPLTNNRDITKEKQDSLMPSVNY